MQGIYEELYTFLLAENVEETKVYCFKNWLTWYIENNLYHIQRNQDGSIEKSSIYKKIKFK